MNPANYREALIETRADEAEGADIIMVCSSEVSCRALSNFEKGVYCLDLLSVYSVWCTCIFWFARKAEITKWAIRFSLEGIGTCLCFHCSHKNAS
jgi:hypothetical protein